MAIRRLSFDEAMAARPRVNEQLLDATTDEDIRRQAIVDGEDPDASVGGHAPVVLPQAVRRKLGMTQEEFAKALRIPVATLRNWEQNRVKPDPAARSLLLIVFKNPEALAALADPDQSRSA